MRRHVRRLTANSFAGTFAFKKSFLLRLLRVLVRLLASLTRSLRRNCGAYGVVSDGFTYAYLVLVLMADAVGYKHFSKMDPPVNPVGPFSSTHPKTPLNSRRSRRNLRSPNFLLDGLAPPRANLAIDPEVVRTAPRYRITVQVRGYDRRALGHTQR